jgi:aldehyde dehydrogenase (NAD+)
MEFNMYKYENLYIDGEWLRNSSGHHTDVINPATNAVCGSVPCGDEDDVDKAVAAAKNAFKFWSVTSSEDRKKYIQAITQRLEERKEDIGRVISAEQGSPIDFACNVQATLPVLIMGSYSEKTGLMDESETIINPIEEGKKSIVFKEPVGVCAFITPWNYPLHQLVTKVAPALAAGCTMVVKPSQEAPLNAYILAEIMEEVGLPRGVFNLVSGPGRSVGEALCQHSGVDMISFTGSTTAGQRITELAAKTVKRVCLELGGKSANIVLDDADLESAISYNISQVTANSGQTCTSLSRLLVPYSCYDEAKTILKRAMGGVIVGRPDEQTTNMGPMVSEAQKKSVLHLMRVAIDEGATLLSGGLDAPEGLESGSYVKPTVFVDVKNSMSIAQEEVFGPVLCVIPYEEEAQAIAIANDSPYGLSGAVWSGSESRALNVAKQLRTGQVYINGAGFNPEAPFGGYKQSGNGREMGNEGLNEFIELKSVQTNIS